MLKLIILIIINVLPLNAVAVPSGAEIRISNGFADGERKDVTSLGGDCRNVTSSCSSSQFFPFRTGTEVGNSNATKKPGCLSVQSCIVLLNGVCGADDSMTLGSAPTNLCTAGVPSSISGTGPWAWSCDGTGGGSNDSCSALAAAIVAGVCGTDDSTALGATPTNLCSAGVASSVSGTGPWAWSCDGTGGGSSDSCSASLVATVNGVCGADNSATLGSTPTNLCSAGVASSVSGAGPWAWSCDGTGGGSNDSCSAFAAAVINGVCGADNSATLGSTPTNLCFVGVASSVSGTGPWAWSCDGTGGGSNDSCSASLIPAVNGICGADDSATLGSTPTNLCSTGVASSVSGTGPWTWSCDGTGGGSNDSCAASAGCVPSTYAYDPGPYESGCFVAGTEVTMADNSKVQIEKIKIGDALLDGNNNRVIVKKTMKYKHRGRKYSINGSHYFVTKTHPFKSLLGGWKAFDPVAANMVTPGLNITQLEIGSIILTESGVELVSIMDWIDSSEPVFNLEVSNSHEFIADGFFVHNKMACPTPGVPNSCMGGDGLAAANASGPTCNAGNAGVTWLCVECPTGGFVAGRIVFTCQSNCDPPSGEP